MKGHLDAKELESYKKEDLQDLARKLGVSDEGTKAEIAARCAAVEVDVPDESELTDEEKAAAQQAAAEQQAAEQQAAAQQAAAQQAAAQQAEKATVEITERYLDKQFNQIKEIGETFTVDKARAEKLVAAKVAKIKE